MTLKYRMFSGFIATLNVDHRELIWFVNEY